MKPLQSASTIVERLLPSAKKADIADAQVRCPRCEHFYFQRQLLWPLEDGVSVILLHVPCVSHPSCFAVFRPKPPRLHDARVPFARRYAFFLRREDLHRHSCLCPAVVASRSAAERVTTTRLRDTASGAVAFRPPEGNQEKVQPPGKRRREKR